MSKIYRQECGQIDVLFGVVPDDLRWSYDPRPGARLSCDFADLVSGISRFVVATRHIESRYVGRARNRLSSNACDGFDRQIKGSEDNAPQNVKKIGSSCRGNRLCRWTLLQ